MNSSTHLDLAFTALADPTRRAILARLSEGEATVAELARPFSISQPAVSRHLKILEQAGLITTAVDAQRRPRRLEAQGLAELSGWIERLRESWGYNFRRLDQLLAETAPALEPERTGS
ncbi:metalloregulator ArsR/SmtB family transcription factor [Phenylobacterium sp.]|jgi:DNA-binding transcriptional ArsR family regulator|uniref:ArsR/SmtB family transcription factor n=1 Tax=Phenylobacterium sp. TaxID=1871053 RepID=UPI002E37634A|nr:metalloregulator ArsR/SmtB family transcription factor [Phenylobacterium sp.]HEX3364222.1 metalloregulator ArsR/SmtB family transcription factor [Phenylobacterium sp.]